MSDTILKIENLSKTFRSNWTFRPIEAVKSLSLEIYRGESFGFLGHNGAGKTTSIKCVLGLIHKSTGRIELDGKELRSADQHRVLGYLPEQPYFYDHLTVEETLHFFGSLHEMKKPERTLRVDETLAQVGLESKRKSPVRALSKGLQQRLGLGQAIINKPKLLLLDEPFSGLDPIGRLEVRELILNLKRAGTTIVMSSHILSDVEDLCDRVSIMARGELKTVFSLTQMAELWGEAYELIVSGLGEKAQIRELVKKLASTHETEQTNAGPMDIFRFKNSEDAHQGMQEALRGGGKVHHFTNSCLSLEDIFMQITGGKRPHEGDSILPGSEHEQGVSVI